MSDDVPRLARDTLASRYVADGGGNVVAARGGGRIALVPGDAPVMVSVEVSQPLPAELRLMVQAERR
jgi:hypothetical protein